MRSLFVAITVLMLSGCGHSLKGGLLGPSHRAAHGAVGAAEPDRDAWFTQCSGSIAPGCAPEDAITNPWARGDATTFATGNSSRPGGLYLYTPTIRDLAR